MRYILIRHGKTAGNEKGLYIGKNLDEPLSEVGIAEAENCHLYDSLKMTPGVKLYSSPMKRARETCKRIFGREGTEVVAHLEMDFGDFEGLNYQQLSGNPEYQRWIDSGGTTAFPGGESRQEFIQRTMKDFWEILSEPAETIVEVCHGGTIMAILSTLTGEEYFDFQVKNLEGYEIEFTLEHERIIDLSYHRIGFGDPV